MAAKFVVAVALFAMCRANPLLINGALYRDGRAFSIGQATSFGGGVSTAQANVNGDAAQAFGSSSGGAQLARDGYFYPGQAIAQAQTYDAVPLLESPYGGAKAVAQAHNGAYYPVPAPANVITYEQNFAVPADASVKSTATSSGNGIAQSSANTQGGIGNYGVTSSNAKTQGFGSADSNANSGFGSVSTSAQTQGEGSAESSAQNNGNGVVGVVYPVAPAVISAGPAPSVIDAKSPIFYTPYASTVPAAAQGVASSNAKVIGSGSSSASARIGHQARTISWRFGTLYDSPASAQAQANTNAGYGAAKSSAHTHGYGAANANVDVNGYSSAKSIADNQSDGHGIAQSSANSHGAGSANANANVNGYNNARSGQYYGGSRLSADAHSHGFGNAAASARTQGVNTSFRVSHAKSSGSAYLNAHAA